MRVPGPGLVAAEPGRVTQVGRDGSRETTAAEAARAMLDASVDALPVVDAHNRVVGLVTGSDLLRLLADTATDSPEDAQPAARPRRPAPD
jgi:CBS domain-containing protein